MIPRRFGDSLHDGQLKSRLTSLMMFALGFVGMAILLNSLSYDESVYAQNGPEIRLSQTNVEPGDQIKIVGTGFTPGGYVGSILLDNTIVDTFDIPGTVIGGPVGGAFSIDFFIPTNLEAGQHVLEICSFKPCATGDQEQRAGARIVVNNARPALDGSVAYVYRNDEAAASTIKDLLAEVGYATRVIPLENVFGTDFGVYDLIIIGQDTGNNNAGVGDIPVWGNALDQDQHIGASGKPILGLGSGGALFFTNVQPSLSLNNGSIELSQELFVSDPTLPFYQEPNNLSTLIEENPILNLYNSDVDVQTVLLQPGDDTVPFPIGYLDKAQEQITLGRGDCRLLWGYDADPGTLNRVGQALFINAAYHALAGSCGDIPLPVCQPLLRPEAMPEPGLINFDTLDSRLDIQTIDEGTLLETLYQESYGVTFPTVPQNRVVATGERAEPRSKPNAAFNQVAPNQQPDGSADAPLRIAFDQPKSHVGFYYGAIDTINGVALLTAFDANNEPLCLLRRTPIPVGHTQFVGIQDAESRIASLTFRYIDSPSGESIDDLYFAPADPPQLPRRIQICVDEGERCIPAPGATLHLVADTSSEDGSVAAAWSTTSVTTGILQDDTAPTRWRADENGLVNVESLLDGSQLWAMADAPEAEKRTAPIANTDRYSLVYTSEVTTITPDRFDADNVMTVAVSPLKPLMLYHAQISSEWILDENYKQLLTTQIISGSNYLYDFTDGQFALGSVTVSQDMANWPFYSNAPSKADMRLYLNNNLRPQAEPGGSVSSLISDTVKPDIAYRPGFMMMGSQWNRFHQPPGDPKIQELLTKYFPGESEAILLEDWPLALAHELGHYLLFLFDTYLAFVEENGQLTVKEVDSCQYSAMGWFYEEENRHFVEDLTDWIHCEETIAHQHLERPEWNVIDDWYPWVIVPTEYITGPVAPPVQLTTVTYIDPPPTSTVGLLDTSIYKLDYSNVITPGASVEARGYLIRNENRAMDQGAPAEESTELEVMGAKVGDRFCVIDINENVAEPAKRRFHFGCESLEVGDTELFLESDPSWTPVIEPIPVGPTSWRVTVRGVTSTLPLSVTFYPEGQMNAQSFSLMPVDSMTSTGVITLEQVTPAAFIELTVANDSAEELNPARRAFIDVGIGGGSMWPGSHWGGFAPIYSPDDTVEFYRQSSVTLGPNQFVAVVRYLNTYPLPDNAVGSSTPYGLVAWPTSLVNDGLINFRMDQPRLATPRTNGSNTEESQDEINETTVVLHRWDGSAWEPLTDTHVNLEPDGVRLVSARSRGAGIYAAIELSTQPIEPNPDPVPSTTLYLPVAR
ncbi:MAG: hypothetical protein AAF702_02940 [Chloroflexota bacterium]